MTTLDLRTVLTSYLRSAREALLWKLDGLSERDARWPRTPTGSNLLGIVKHAAGVEAGYFGECFGRPWDGEPMPWMELDAEDNADMWATREESTADIVDLYRRVWTFADDTIATRDLTAVGSVAWWPSARREVTLAQVITHVTADLMRHAGHADILRELTDGQIGMKADSPNLPGLDGAGWADYVARLKRTAEEMDRT